MTDFEHLLELAVPSRPDVRDVGVARATLAKLGGASTNFTATDKKVEGKTAGKARKFLAGFGEDRLDGIAVYLLPELGIFHLDVMDWGDGDVGDKIERGLKKITGHVVRVNEGARPLASRGWVKLAGDRLWVYACPDCGADSYNGMPGEGARFRGSAQCSACGKHFSVVHRTPKHKDGPLLCTEATVRRPTLKTGFDADVPTLVLVKHAGDEDTVFTVAVDLDGTLAEKEEPFDPKSIGKPRERTVFWVRLFKQAGARIIVFTVRGDTELVKSWCEEHDVPCDHVNENPDQPPNSSGKVFAHVYFDDRAFNAEDPDEHGPTILDKVLEFNRPDDEEEDEDNPTVNVTVTHTTWLVTAPELLEAMGAGAGCGGGL